MVQARPIGRRSLPHLVVGLCLLATAGVGFGATTSSVTVSTDVQPVISITEPSAVDPAPAPQNGATWVAGAPGKIDLGELQGTEQATASATWRVTTNAPNGYSLSVANTRPSGSVLQTTGGGAYPDMPDSPAGLNPNTSSFGIAVGDSVNHAQPAVAFGGSPWGTSGGGGTQGTLYRSVPAAGVQIGGRSAPAVADPITINFAATLSAAQPLPAGAYAGTVRLTASTL